MCLTGCSKPAPPSSTSAPASGTAPAGSGTPAAGSGTACTTQPCQPPPATLEITDAAATPNVLNGTTQTTIVGKRVSLRVRTNPLGRTLTNIQWTIPDERVKNYTQSHADGVRTDLAPADLQRDSIDFYWISHRDKLVIVRADVDGASQNASVTFRVLRPTVDHFTLTASSVNVSSAHFASPGNPTLAAYQPTPAPAKFGCQWDAKVTAPAGGDGQIGFTQKILVNRSWTNNAGTVRRFGSGGVLVLDNGLGIQYSGPQPITAGGSATLNGPSYADSPWIPLLATDQAASADERFELYLMYRPTGADSIWVTLAMGTWSWKGQTTRIGAPAGAGNNWNAASGAGMTPTGTANGADSTSLPTWHGNYGTSTWS